jgi:GxxExxY protein
MSLPFESLTEKILEAAFEVSNELGTGFLESVYEQSLFIALRGKGICVARQVPIRVFFRGQLAGMFQADLVVENDIILELKAAKALLPEHQAQVLNYLKASGKPVGLLINFGQPRVAWMRFDNWFDKDEKNKDERDESEKKQDDGNQNSESNAPHILEK